VRGNLTMHGVTREIKFTVLVQGTDTDPWNNLRAGLEAVATLNRSDFDMKSTRHSVRETYSSETKSRSRSRSPRSCRRDGLHGGKRSPSGDLHDHGSRLAPPISAPSTSGCISRSSALSSLTSRRRGCASARGSRVDAPRTRGAGRNPRMLAAWIPSAHANCLRGNVGASLRVCTGSCTRTATSRRRPISNGRSGVRSVRQRAERGSL
jgi:hypothetical protein